MLNLLQLCGVFSSDILVDCFTSVFAEVKNHLFLVESPSAVEYVFPLI